MEFGNATQRFGRFSWRKWWENAGKIVGKWWDFATSNRKIMRRNPWHFDWKLPETGLFENFLGDAVLKGHEDPIEKTCVHWNLISHSHSEIKPIWGNCRELTTTS
jgi:hypothetical protein